MPRNVMVWCSVVALVTTRWRQYLIASVGLDGSIMCHQSIWGGSIHSTRNRYKWLAATVCILHDDVIKWKHFPRCWPFVQGIHLSPVNSPHKGTWRGALMFSLICAWINGWVNNHDAGDLRLLRSHYDVIVSFNSLLIVSQTTFSNAFSWLKNCVEFHWSFFPMGLIDNKLKLVQVMAWRRTRHYLNQWWPISLTHICGTEGTS